MSCYLPDELLEFEWEVGPQTERQALLQREIKEADSRIESMYSELESLKSLKETHIERISGLEKSM